MIESEELFFPGLMGRKNWREPLNFVGLWLLIGATHKFV